MAFFNLFAVAQKKRLLAHSLSMSNFEEMSIIMIDVTMTIFQ